MAEDKTRREFLQNASLAGAALVAGAAAISAAGCTSSKSVKPTCDFDPETGVLTVTDPDLAQRIYDQLEKNGELTGIYYDEDRERKTRKTDTKGSPHSRDAMRAMMTADSMAMAPAAGATGATIEPEALAGVTVQLTVADKDADVAGGKVIVNSLCGCR